MFLPTAIARKHSAPCKSCHDSAEEFHAVKGNATSFMTSDFALRVIGRVILRWLNNGDQILADANEPSLFFNFLAMINE